MIVIWYKLYFFCMYFELNFESFQDYAFFYKIDNNMYLNLQIQVISMALSFF